MGDFMGYRSEVVIVIYGDTDEITAFVASERLKGIPKGMEYYPLHEPISDFHRRDTYEYGEGQTVMKFTWHDVKWYDTYPEIAYWENLASVWEDAFSNTSLCMEMGRVGEEQGDVEVTYYGDVDYFLSSVTYIDEENMPSRTNIGDIKLKGEQDE